MDLPAQEYIQGNCAENFAFVVQIVLRCRRQILDFKDKNALKLTCKATRAVVHPLFTSLRIKPEKTISLEQFISACHGTTLLPWNPSHVEAVYLDAGNVTLKTLKMFMALPMPNLNTLTVSNSSHPTLFAQGDWPQLTYLELSFSQEIQSTIEIDGDQTVNPNPPWPLTSLTLTFKDDKHVQRDLCSLLSNILATYSNPKILKLDIMQLNHSSVIPSLSEASLPLLEELKIHGSADNLMNQIAMAKNWPQIRHLELGDHQIKAFKDLNLQSCSWIKQLETFYLSGEVELTPHSVSNLMESLQGGRVKKLYLGFLTKDFSEFRGLRNSYLPHLTVLTLSALNEDDHDWLPNLQINELMDTIYDAQFPSLQFLHMLFPMTQFHEECLWDEAPSKPGRIAFPNLKEFGVAYCSIHGNVPQYLNTMRLGGCELDLRNVRAEKDVDLSPKLDNLLDHLELSFIHLDNELEKTGLWHDFWCWGMSEEKMAVAIVDAAISYTNVYLDSQVAVRPLKRVVALLEGAEEGSLMAELARKSASWTETAKKTLHVIKEFRGEHCYESDDDSELDNNE